MITNFKIFENKKNDYKILYNLIKDYNIEEIKKYIKSNKNLDGENKYGATPLYYAIYKQHVNIVKLLLENGADVNHKAKDNSTPLHIAAFNTNTNTNASKKILELLIEYGGDWNILTYEPFVERDVDFLEYLKNDEGKPFPIYYEIINKYPDKYQKYLKWKNLDKFNI